MISFYYANTPIKRLIGLYGKKNIFVKIYPCNDIHTFFMKRDIDVAFFNSRGVAIESIKQLKPWRRIRRRDASFVIERYSKDSPWYEPGDYWKEVKHESLSSM